MRISDLVDTDDRPDELPERVACSECGRGIPVGAPCPNCGGEPEDTESLLDRSDPDHNCQYCGTRFDRYQTEDGDPRPAGRLCPECGAKPCPSCGVRREGGDGVCPACGNSRTEFVAAG